MLYFFTQMRFAVLILSTVMSHKRRVGKLLIMGALFKCLDPVLTIAAALSGKSPFVRPFGAAAEAAAAQCRKSFAQDRSDSLAVAAVYKVCTGTYSRFKYVVVYHTASRCCCCL
jgi:HrpA-like RNA helicase